MRAIEYQRYEFGTCCVSGPAEPSITRAGFDAAFVTKKKSGPCPSHAVPSTSFFPSNVERMASCNLGSPAPARAISSVTLDFCAAQKRPEGQTATKIASKQRRAY